MINCSCKPNFNLAEKTATKLLLLQNNLSLRIDVKSLEYNKNIIFDTFQNYSNLVGVSLLEFSENGVLNDGCVVDIGHTKLILYDAYNNNQERLNFTLAHEVGHIYLGHQKDGPIEEVEANFFAAQLLMPEIAILELSKRLDTLDYFTLYMLFNVTMPAAQKRIDTISRKCRYNMGYEEQKLLCKFKDEIERVCNLI